MEGTANFSHKNVDDIEKESFDVSYTVKNCGSVEMQQKVKEAFDKAVVILGGQTTLDETIEEKPETV